jgi:two-component system, LytTR family, sensor kinase
MGTAENIFLLSLNMLLGSLVVLVFLIGYVWYFTKDKTIGFYGLYLLAAIVSVVGKKISIAGLAPGANIMENSWLDDWLGCFWGCAYFLFFTWVFQLFKNKISGLLSKVVVAVMLFQFLYLLYYRITNDDQYYNSFIWLAIFIAVTVLSLFILIAALLQKNKTTFQKIIAAGSVVFYILILVVNLQEYLFKASGAKGFNIFFAALLVENIFFVVAASHLIKNIYEDAARVKLNGYRYQLEIEQVTAFFSATIHNHDDKDELLWDVAKNLIGKLDFEDCMIYLWNEDKTVLLQRAGYGSKGSMQNEIDKNIYHVPKGKGIVGAAIESGRYILANDTTLDKRYFSADNKIRLSELCVPIIHNKKTIGAINTEHQEKNFYTERHLQILTTIASMLADKIDKITAQHQTREKEVEVLKLNKDLATSQLTTLRAQMNPHFIFNALNSVQQYILQGNITEANRYLSKFSKLQREVLNHSDQNFISLEKELEVLNLYLELEQLRFDGNFKYEIKTDADIDDDEIKIPPMIIQPFVENAIWHGLMPRQGDRWVHIHFELSNDDLLVCTVTDNGIGREAAARLKQNGHTQHKSKGLSLVYDRLNILRQQYGQAFEVNIKDIIDSNNVPAGTEVKLHIYTG